jgi:hypothetical protein
MKPTPPTKTPFAYESAEAPPWYACTGCATGPGVKLWRPAHDDAGALCAACVERRAGLPPGLIGDDGRSPTKHGDETDQVGGRVPYVPCEDGESAWGYTSVPAEGVAWWHALPTRPAESGAAARAAAFDRMWASLSKTVDQLVNLRDRYATVLGGPDRIGQLEAAAARASASASYWGRVAGQ